MGHLFYSRFSRRVKLCSPYIVFYTLSLWSPFYKNLSKSLPQHPHLSFLYYSAIKDEAQSSNTARRLYCASYTHLGLLVSRAKIEDAIQTSELTLL